MNKPGPAEAGKAQSYLTRLSQTIDALDTEAFDRAIGLIRAAWQNDKQIIVFGNGGSALTAQHYVTDWNKAIYLKTGRPFRGVCLAANMGPDHGLRQRHLLQ
jgi:D-sedoheptulose 7-phosphate isomerase